MVRQVGKGIIQREIAGRRWRARVRIGDDRTHMRGYYGQVYMRHLANPLSMSLCVNP